MNTPENLVFVADRHGRADLQRAVVNRFGKDAQYVFVGDHIDGSTQEPELLSELRDLYDPETRNVIMGNHEFDRVQAIKAAIMCKDDPSNPDAETWSNAVRQWSMCRAMGGVAFAAYGIEHHINDNPIDSTIRLYERMQENGLFDFINSLPLYYEDDKHIAIHAGLTDEPWEQQKTDLDIAEEKLKYTDEIGMDPDQLYRFKLATQKDAFTATDKIVVTGHMPIDGDIDGRITGGGKRIRLDSSVKCPKSRVIYAYHADTQAVVAVEAPVTKPKSV